MAVLALPTTSRDSDTAVAAVHPIEPSGSTAPEEDEWRLFIPLVSTAMAESPPPPERTAACTAVNRLTGNTFQILGTDFSSVRVHFSDGGTYIQVGDKGTDDNQPVTVTLHSNGASISFEVVHSNGTVVGCPGQYEVVTTSPTCTSITAISGRTYTVRGTNFSRLTASYNDTEIQVINKAKNDNEPVTVTFPNLPAGTSVQLDISDTVGQEATCGVVTIQGVVEEDHANTRTSFGEALFSNQPYYQSTPFGN